MIIFASCILLLLATTDPSARDDFVLLLSGLSCFVDLAIDRLDRLPTSKFDVLRVALLLLLAGLKGLTNAQMPKWFGFVVWSVSFVLLVMLGLSEILTTLFVPFFGWINARKRAECLLSEPLKTKKPAPTSVPAAEIVPPPQIRRPASPQTSPRTPFMKTKTMMIPAAPIKATMPSIPFTCPIPCVMINDDEDMEEINHHQELACFSPPRGDAPFTNDNVVPGAPIKPKNPSVPVTLSIPCRIMPSSILRQSRHRPGPPPVDRLCVNQAEANAEQLGSWEFARWTCPVVPITEDDMWNIEKYLYWREKINGCDANTRLDVIDRITLKLSKHQTQDTVTLPGLTRAQILSYVGPLTDTDLDSTIPRITTITFSAVLDDRHRDVIHQQAPSPASLTSDPLVENEYPGATIHANDFTVEGNLDDDNFCFDCGSDCECDRCRFDPEELNDDWYALPISHQPSAATINTFDVTIPCAVPDFQATQQSPSQTTASVKVVPPTALLVVNVELPIPSAPIVLHDDDSVHDLFKCDVGCECLGCRLELEELNDYWNDREILDQPSSVTNVELSVPCAVTNLLQATPSALQKTASIAVVPATAPSVTEVELAIPTDIPNMEATQSPSLSISPVAIVPSAAPSVTKNELDTSCAVTILKATQLVLQKTAFVAVVPAAAPSVTKVELAIPFAVPNMEATQSPSQKTASVAIVSITGPCVADVELPVIPFAPIVIHDDDSVEDFECDFYCKCQRCSIEIQELNAWFDRDIQHQLSSENTKGVEVAVSCAVANLQATQSPSQSIAPAAVVPATAPSVTKVELAIPFAVPNMEATQSSSQASTPVEFVSHTAPSVTKVELPIIHFAPIIFHDDDSGQDFECDFYCKCQRCSIEIQELNDWFDRDIQHQLSSEDTSVEVAVSGAVLNSQETKSPSQSIAPVAIIPSTAPSVIKVELSLSCTVPNMEATQSSSQKTCDVPNMQATSAPSVTDVELAIFPNMQATQSSSQKTASVDFVSFTAPSVTDVELPIPCAVQYAQSICHAEDLVTAPATWEESSPEVVQTDVSLPVLPQPTPGLACRNNATGSVQDHVLGHHISLPTKPHPASLHQVRFNRCTSPDRNRNANPGHCHNSPLASPTTRSTTRQTTYTTRSGRVVRSPDRFGAYSVTQESPPTKLAIQTPPAPQRKNKVRPNRRVDTQRQHNSRDQPASRSTPVQGAYTTRSGRRVVPPSRLTVEEFRLRRH